MVQSVIRRKIVQPFLRASALPAALAAVLALGACASPSAPRGSAAWDPGVPEVWRQARILEADTSLQCVPYARQISGIEIRGDAWTWWGQARGRYQRGRKPEPGAILVLKESRKSAGHLAVIVEIVNDRIVVASHANWLNRGHIHERTPIQDVSERGDWSAVRVWYTPGAVWGRSIYPAYGFIYPRPLVAADR